jgi:hypothetical protein
MPCAKAFVVQHRRSCRTAKTKAITIRGYRLIRYAQTNILPSELDVGSCVWCARSIRGQVPEDGGRNQMLTRHHDQRQRRRIPWTGVVTSLVATNVIKPSLPAPGCDPCSSRKRSIHEESKHWPERKIRDRRKSFVQRRTMEPSLPPKRVRRKERVLPAKAEMRKSDRFDQGMPLGMP